MKLANLYWPLLVLLPFVVMAQDAESKKMPSYSMMLMGGGVTNCSSLNKIGCKDGVNWRDQDKTAAQFKLDDKHLNAIANAEIWQPKRQAQKEQLLVLLRFLQTKLADAPVTERELWRMFRSSEVELNGQWLSGREVQKSLTGQELNFITDQLEIQVVNSRGERMKEVAAATAIDNAVSLKLYQKFVALATEVSGKNQPTILVMTAASRDPFAAVDYYTDLFKQLGARSTWFPVNAAYQSALRDPAGEMQGCEHYLQHLTQSQKAYQRGRVYPDLLSDQKQFCQKGHAEAVAMLKRADAVFFNGGDQSLLLQALINPDGSDSPELAQIRTMLARGELVVGGTSAGTAVMAGGEYQGKQAVMISSGISRVGLTQGAFAKAAPAPGCHLDQSCGDGLSEDSLTYQASGGLALFPWGVLDTHFSERGRQGRLWRLQLDTQTPWGFGIDENTALLVQLNKTKNAAAEFAVMGQGGVYVSQLTPNTKHQGPLLEQLTSHYFTQDDQFSLHGAQIQSEFASWKFAKAGSPLLLVNSGDLFIGDNYRTLAQLFCSSQSSEAVGSFEVAGNKYRVTLQRDAKTATRQGQYLNGNQAQFHCGYRDIRISVAMAP